MLSAIANLPSRVLRSTRSAVCASAIIALLVMSMEGAASAVEVYLLPVAPVGYETNSVPAKMKVVRSSTVGALQVQLSLNPASTATLGGTNDYTVAGVDDPAFATTDSDGDPTTTVTFPDGQREMLITLTPIDDGLVEARENAVFTLKPIASSYVIGAPSSMSLTIADNDHKARIEVPDPIADEDSALFGLVSDPDVQRRAVMRVRFDKFTTATTFTRNLAVQFVTTGGTKPIATLDTDYKVHYKICGNGTTGAGNTSERSRIGYDKVNVRGTGLGYTLIAHLAGDTQISISGGSSGSGGTTTAITPGSSIQFGNHSTVYTVASSGTNGLVLSSPLTANLPNGTTITVLGGSTTTSTFTVNRVYPAGSIDINVGFGSGGLFEGDVFQLEGLTGFYVVTSDTVSLTSSPVAGSSGVLHFRRYQGSGAGGGGLESDLGGSPALTTLIAATVAGGVMQVLVPEESTKVEISVTPTANGDGAEGVEEVRMRMIADEDYEILTPQESSVYIADRDVTTSISLQSNAGLPNQTGYFKVTFSKPFPVPITVPYLVTDDVPNTVTPTNDEYEETIPPSVTLLAGQTEALIQVDPIVAAGPATVTLTLIGTLDYKLAGSTSSGVNPSATMDISNAVGAVSIAATTPTATESATTPPASNGLFTVSILRNPGQNGAVGINLGIGGTAVIGSRYELFDPGTNATYAPTNSQIQVTIPAASNSITVGVRPINNFIADNNQIVQMSVIAGQSYTVGAAANAFVSIVDDEPTITLTVVNNAARPSTPGVFRFSYVPVGGVALSQAITVNYTFSGTGVRNTDYTAQTSVTINSGNTSTDLAINPIDTPDGSAVTVTVTVDSSTTYNGTPSATMNIGASSSPSNDKPTPGTVNSGTSGGGCGLGSGVAGLAGLGLFALVGAFRRRKP